MDITLAKEGRDCAVYLADAREVTDPTSGQPIAGKVSFHLPEGDNNVCLYSPAAGQHSPRLPAVGGRESTFELAPFTEDLVIRVTRVT